MLAHFFHYEYHDKSQHNNSQVHINYMRQLFILIRDSVRSTQGLIELTAELMRKNFHKSDPSNWWSLINLDYFCASDYEQVSTHIAINKQYWV